MPVFIDKHEAHDLPREKWRRWQMDVDQKRRDRNGVATLAVVLDQETREVTCITEAPDAESVRRHHSDEGVQVRDVHPADALL